ncbi:response regulator transcription factor [uncultured Parabacteroides sp.]|jgi:two-component system LytT family response regulator|uniref:LytR/AlgR family response regulator transcription factor n=1 Tax=uncultured Parabacteroides sp. TaxID=512312 RepID=UPI0025F42BA9|nr:response regulator transcription factor [uncultured Parabacteroides sp.]
MNMNEITTIIVDDEPACIKTLECDLLRFPEIRTVATCTTPDNAVREIVRLQPDLLFLDVEMPGMSGLELLSRIQSDIHPGMHIVFYTAYDKYLLDAIHASAFDYLLKPYKLKELDNLIIRLHTHIGKSEKVNLEQSLRKLLIQNTKFAVQTISGLVLVKYEEILLFQYLKDQRCWQMIQTDRKQHKLRMSTTAKDLLGISSSFVQISQDCIVNLNYLCSIENVTLKCSLAPSFSDIVLTVSQRYYRRLKEALEIF